MYKVTLNLPNLSQGAEVELDGLGIFKNGEEKLVSKDEADAFRVKHTTVHTVFDDEGNYVGERFDSGPTLTEAFKSNRWVEVEVVKAPTKKELEAASKETSKTEVEGGES